MRLRIFSVVPSPYQRDFFEAVAAKDGLDLEVLYLEHAAPDSPWQSVALADWESVLPGVTLGTGRVRSHMNLGFKSLPPVDATIINTPTTALTTQRLLRTSLPGRLLFWGEELLPAGSGAKAAVQRQLREPIGRCDAILAVGRRAVARYEADFPATRVENLPYHCDLTAFSREAASGDAMNRPTTFLFCGQMIRRKGLDLLVEAFRQAVTEQKMDARLLLAGRPAEEGPWLEALAADVRERIEVVGFVQPDALPKLFARADVFVLPSRHDGWGVVVNQAVGAGLPIIASDGVGAAVDLVHDGVSGLIVPAGEIPSLAKAMATLAADPKMIASFSKASIDHAADITPQAGADKLDSILRSLPS